MDTMSNLENNKNMTKVDAMRELWRALDFSSAEILQAALDAGADINAVHPEECLTALQYAVIGRRTGRRSIEMLIAAGVDVNAADRKGVTPLMLAVGKYAHRQAVKLLLAAGADVNARDEDGCTALMKARREESIKLLIEAGADVNAADKCGCTALHHLASAGVGAPFLKLLIDAGADVNARSMSGCTAIILAAGHFCSSGPFRVLLDAGAEVNAADAYGTTALSVASAWGEHDRPRRLLLEAGADDSKKIVAGDATFHERYHREKEAANPGYIENNKMLQDLLLSYLFEEDDDELDSE